MSRQYGLRAAKKEVSVVNITKKERRKK